MSGWRRLPSGVDEACRGGADAVVVREWDVVERRFIEDGFNLPESKTNIDWEGPDTVLVGTGVRPRIDDGPATRGS